MRKWAIRNIHRTLGNAEQVINAYLREYKDQPNNELLHILDSMKKYREKLPDAKEVTLIDAFKTMIPGIISASISSLAIAEVIQIPKELVLAAIAALIGVPLACSMAGIVGSMYVWDVPWYYYQAKQHKVADAKKNLMQKLTPFAIATFEQLSKKAGN